ncbi:type II secretion system protein [Nitrosomonas sp.]|uniref:type II secretion system protein n=1 Tax=Nitrosomonas sp. TaxID=42353 RepID=UPI002845CC78|nr:type II secretion system protein [Nitrosomonas sp.]MDR4513763.1 type II secretion system GspH family protein [Nitrosomonas sp.]
MACFSRRYQHSGFTLIELMIVLAIMAVLATAAMPLRELSVKREKEHELRIALRQIRNAIDAYKQAVDDGRIEKKEDESGYPSALEDLVRGVPDIKSAEPKNIYFLRRLPRDPMFEDMDVAGIEQTPAAETWGLRSYESSAENPKEGDDVFDVYSLSDAVGLNGIEYSKW